MTEPMNRITKNAAPVHHKSVGVITFFNYCNFGAALQSYGLSESLRKLGYRVEYIDYTCPFIARAISMNSLRKRGLVGLVYTAAGHFFYLPRHSLFAKFRNLIPHTPPVSPDTIASYGGRYDTYITGSDQVWSTKLTDFDKTYFLDFVKPGHRKVSYAASFGGQTIDEDRRDEYAELLSDFDSISVREDYGRDLVRDLTGVEAAITLDPTLLLTKEEWSSIAAPRQKKDPYVLVYQLGFSGRVVEAARAVSRALGLKVEYVPFPLGGAIPARLHLRLGPSAWLALFRDADYVVTDSYHGIIFSILFEKKFVVVAGGQHKNQRVVSLLTWLGLTDRIFDEELPVIDAPIDYSEVKARLAEARAASLGWLREHI